MESTEEADFLSMRSPAFLQNKAADLVSNAFLRKAAAITSFLMMILQIFHGIELIKRSTMNSDQR